MAGRTGYPATDLKNSYVDDNDGNVAIRVIGQISNELIPTAHDYIALTYVAAGNGAGQIETVTYKTGGASGTTIATLTLSYDGSDRISTVTRS